MATENDWDGVICPICGKGFTAKAWDERHTVPFGRHQGEDCHARCCPHPDCVWARTQARKAKEAAT